ncbi:glycine N-acyltransferase-like protein 2 [Sarcophilus harrisii]|uniref:Glycine N-acyltransferase-like protein n=1 Tax=Sarcophilus harrisii TaxID=9305 RepID=G3VM25_SARHA|nr:glycine N-acyltransferase-like protein 2 [Sarcophilus harrisii]XP_031797820.1 glycine N-acyltransferase-like protein 2 [Sarcophilus harrisii]
MLLLQEVQMLQALHRSLAKSIPESLKVYGSIFHINRGNPFNLEVLVDSWPEYQTVITRAPKKKMTDDMDHYTNTYHIFTKIPERLPEILESDNIINWDQILTIQGCQQGLDEKIKSIAASKAVQIDYSKRFLYATEAILQLKSSNTRMFGRSHEEIIQNTGKFRSKVGNLKPTLLDVSHSELVNNNWKFGKNEKSLRYIKSCIQNFPGYCLLDSEGNPITWSVMEATCELRMACTLPGYRGMGILGEMMKAYMQHLHQNEIPFYLHVEDMNKNSHKAVRRLGFRAMPCEWHEWKSIPIRFQQLPKF